jgi:hypothetical protein
MDNDTKPTIILVTDKVGAKPCPSLFEFLFLCRSGHMHCFMHCMSRFFNFPYAIINKDIDIEYPEMCYRNADNKRS